MTPQLLDHLFTHLPLLLNRDFLLDLLTTTSKTRAYRLDDGRVVIDEPCYIYDGKLLDIAGALYGVVGGEGIKPGQHQTVQVCDLGMPTAKTLAERNTVITVPPGVLVNVAPSGALTTTLGRFVLNYTILIDPFGDLISYINEVWKIATVEKTIFEALRTGRITVDQVKHYSRNIHFIGHFTELGVPSFTERSLTVDPRVIAKRDALLVQYRSQIDAGDTVVMSKIEAELIALDRELLKGDASTGFYDYTGKKSYEIHRKTMQIMGGLVQEFGDKGYSFVEGSLEEGWDIKNFPVLCNEIRRGSYNRAKETAKGGEETKFLIRVFQNTQVTEEDCQTTHTLTVELDRSIADAYLYRNILVNGALIALTEENLSTYIGQTVHMRSPQHCATKVGYCYTCMGELFRTINQEVITMSAVNVTKTFTLASLKSIHGTAVKRIEVTSLNRFVV